MPGAQAREASLKVPAENVPTTHESKSCLQTCGQEGCGGCNPRHSVSHVQMILVTHTRLVDVSYKPL